MDFQTIKARDDQYVLNTYARFPVDVDHGKNATLYSAEGREYIDFTSGIGVNSIGCANPKWVDAIAVQAARLGHMSNLFYTQPCGPEIFLRQVREGERDHPHPEKFFPWPHRHHSVGHWPGCIP